MEHRQHGQHVIVGGEPCMCWLITPFQNGLLASTAPFGRPVVPEV